MKVIKLKIQFVFIIKYQDGINNKTKTNWMKLIYLHLYKDTYLIFMQAYEPLQGILNYFKN